MSKKLLALIVATSSCGLFAPYRQQIPNPIHPKYSPTLGRQGERPVLGAEDYEQPGVSTEHIQNK